MYNKIILTTAICLFTLMTTGCTNLSPPDNYTVDTRYQKLRGFLRPLAIAYEEDNETEVNKWIPFLVPRDENRFLVSIITDGNTEAVRIAFSEKIEIVNVDNRSILAYISYKMFQPLNNHANIKSIKVEGILILE